MLLSNNYTPSKFQQNQKKLYTVKLKLNNFHQNGLLFVDKTQENINFQQNFTNKCKTFLPVLPKYMF